MGILAFIIAVYTLPMLVIHLSTARILRDWNGAASSWMMRHFPPHRALRVEALYWLLGLVAWPIWRVTFWKTLVVLFAAIHLGAWLAGEFGRIRLSGETSGSPSDARRLNRAIITFDLIEAIVLIVVGMLAAFYLFHAPGQLHTVES